MLNHSGFVANAELKEGKLTHQLVRFQHFPTLFSECLSSTLRLQPSTPSAKSSKPPYPGTSNSFVAKIGQMKRNCFGFFGRRLTSLSSIAPAFGLETGSITSLSGCSVSSCSLLAHGFRFHQISKLVATLIQLPGKLPWLNRERTGTPHINVLGTQICWDLLSSGLTAVKVRPQSAVLSIWKSETVHVEIPL